MRLGFQFQLDVSRTRGTRINRSAIEAIGRHMLIIIWKVNRIFYTNLAQKGWPVPVIKPGSSVINVKRTYGCRN